jgi:hypothetical protein
MSRSKHQRHKFFHNKRQPHPYRNRKIKPYGLKGWCNYGGEFYSKRLGEICIDLVNKTRYRRLLKKKMLEEIKLQNK